MGCEGCSAGDSHPVVVNGVERSILYNALLLFLLDYSIHLIKGYVASRQLLVHLATRCEHTDYLKNCRSEAERRTLPTGHFLNQGAAPEDLLKEHFVDVETEIT